MLALFKEHTVGAQLLREADPTAEELTVKNLLPLSFIEVQELTQQVTVRLSLQDGAGVQIPSLGSTFRSTSLQLGMFAATAGDLQWRLQPQKIQSLLLEELDPGEEHHTAAVLLPQIIQTLTQRRQLRNR